MDNYHWRSDIDRIEVVEHRKRFIEYTKSGVPTTFTITEFAPCERYAFDMENARMHGRWIGIFRKTADGSEIDFTENVTAKSVFMKPFVKLYLVKQQATYVRDLKCALREE